MNSGTRQHLVELLSDAVQRTVFSRRDGRGRSIAADRYRRLWSDPGCPPDRLSSYSMEEPSGLGELIQAAASALGRFVGENQAGNPVVYSNIELIVANGGFDRTPLDHFCRMLLLASVRTSPEGVVDLMASWLNGTPIPYTRVLVLSGVTMEDGEFSVSPHVRVGKLPSNSLALERIGVPLGLTGWPCTTSVPGAVSVYGRVALLRDVAMGPAFREPDDQSLPADLLDPHPIGRNRDILQNSLSLACNAPVRTITGWHRVADRYRAFSVLKSHAEPHFWSTRHDQHFTHDQIGELDEESLALACDLATKLDRNPLGERTALALRRWTRALPTDHPVAGGGYPDQYTDLRIALERLFAPDGGAGGITVLTSKRCARFLEHGLRERKALDRKVKSIYRTTSTFTHNPSAKQETKRIRDLNEARRVVRRSILKVIDEGCADPDLDALDFG